MKNADSATEAQKTSTTLIAASVGLAAAIFVVDLSLPLGVAGGVPYVALVLVSLGFPRRQHVLAAATAGTILTVLGFFFSPSGGIPWMVFFNRFLAVFAIWVTAILGLHHKQHQVVREREVKFRTLAENTTSLIFVYQGTRIRYVNPATVALTGYTEKELLGMNFWDVIHPDSREFVKQRGLARQQGEQVPARYEVKFLTKTGEERWVDAKMGLIEFGGEPSVLGTGFDVTERKRAEEALKKSEERYRDLFENANDIIYTIDLDGNFTSLNRVGERISGYTRDEIVNMNIAQVVAPENLELARQVTRRRLAGEEPESYELELVAKGGHRVPLEVNGRLIYQDDKPVGVQGIARDITERKRAEEALKQSQEQLRQAQKMEAVGRLSGGVAHDFNNLLMVIRGYNELLLNELEEDDSLRPKAVEIQKAADRASSLTRQLLAFSRRQVLQPKVLDLNTAIADTERMLLRLIGEDIELTSLLEPELGRVRADPSQMQQLILNLAVNARDAMPEGGKLTLESSNVELDDAFAHEHPEVVPGRYVSLAVRDTGSGMDAETRSRIFEPFFTTKEKDKGTGLGLSTVYGIVKQSGGYIWVESEPGLGTAFKIYLPRLEATEEEAKLEETSAPPPRGSETILVVEDEMSVRRLARQFLEEYGYRVLEAINGREAVQVSEQHQGPIHLLLADIVLPGISGQELAKRLVSQRPEMRVLYMSGFADNTIVHHGVLDEGTTFLQKPFTLDALARNVRNVLEET